LRGRPYMKQSRVSGRSLRRRFDWGRWPLNWDSKVNPSSSWLKFSVEGNQRTGTRAGLASEQAWLGIVCRAGRQVLEIDPVEGLSLRQVHVDIVIARLRPRRGNGASVQEIAEV
jgi:hypothetical protein